RSSRGPQKDNTSAPAASDTQLPQATATDAEEDIKCPICWDTVSDEGSIACCTHIFCFSCIFTWSRIRAVCPICHIKLRSFLVMFLIRAPGRQQTSL
uniref:RING-type E3 ubiquitin transferase n=1 Tax=Calidris pygmaea TaxID=425635 RepID=A0A8C3J0V3_9CHAR